MFAVRDLKSSIMALMAAQATVVNIKLVNQCSNPVKPLIIGRNSYYQLDAIQPTVTLVVPFMNDFQGAIFDGFQPMGTEAQAYLSLSNGYYAVLHDPDKVHQSLLVVPSLPETSDGFCATSVCDNTSCRNSAPLVTPPMIPSGFPSTPPEPPLYQCGTDGLVTFSIIFCGQAVPAQTSTATSIISAGPQTQTGASSTASIALTVASTEGWPPSTASSDPPLYTASDEPGYPTTSTSTTSQATSTATKTGKPVKTKTKTKKPVQTSTSKAPPPQPQPSSFPVMQIHPGGDNSKCMDVVGNIQKDGTPVDIYDCNGTGAQQWQMVRHKTQIRLAGTNFCLDAGSNIGSGQQMKIWTCYDGLPQQTWWWTDDNRLAVMDHGQCLDLPMGFKYNGNVLQTWQCLTGNNNQLWTE